MNRKSGFLVLFVFFCMITAWLGCKKIISIKTETSSSYLVIDGTVSNTINPVKVLLSRSVELDSVISSPVSGAVVVAKDSTIGFADTLSEQSSGTYTSKKISGIPGHTYSLRVLVHDSIFTANSTMPYPVKLDSVTLESTQMMDYTQINAVMNFQDPKDTVNYYQFREYVNEVQVPDIFPVSDRLFDGNYEHLTLYNDTAYIFPGDKLMVEMDCIDKKVYNYLYVSSNNAINSGFVEYLTPSNPVTNISGGAIGVFSAQAVSRIAISLPNNLTY